MAFRNRYAILIAAFVGVFFSRVAHAQFDLIVNATGFSPTEQLAIDEAELRWENVISGYQPGIALASITISIDSVAIDGTGGVLGQAGPSGSTFQGGFRLTRTGNMDIDSADVPNLLANGTLDDVVAHEFGHILGIGTQWTSNNVYTNGSGEYTGAFGLAAYQTEFDSNATFVPVELDGGGGTANSHWDELGNVFDPEGQPLSQELMTGFLGGSNFLSMTTVESLRDIGFEVVGGLTGVLGDVNQDGFLTGDGNGLPENDDIAAFIAGWRSDTVGLSALDKTLRGDLNLNGLTDLSDWFILREAFSTAGLGEIQLGNFLNAVPEPSSVFLAITVIAGLMLNIQRRHGSY